MKTEKNKRINVTIIIPCYNEEKYIGECLESLVENDYPKNKLEILVYDGGSIDNTREIIRGYKKTYPYIRLIDNFFKIQVQALNMGIKQAKGNILIRCDAHAEYPSDYIRTLVYYLINDKADNVGGVWDTHPGSNSNIAKVISICLKHPFGVGFSYRMPHQNRPRYVETVPFGAWKKEIFEEIGEFDESFIRGEDMESNMRIRKAGKRILLLPDLKIKYYARETLSKLAKMSYQYGYAKVMLTLKHKTLPNYRHLFPPTFVCGIPFAFLVKPIIWLYIIYFVLSFAIGIYESIIHKKTSFVILLPLTFFIMHIMYGVGYITGIFDWLRRKKFSRIKWDITR